MKAKFCDIGQHEVTVLFHSRKADRASCCPKCYRPDQSIVRKEKVATKVCIKAREPIKKVSSKQAKINTAYSVLRLQYLKMFPNCGVSSDDCTHIATQVHHRAGRIGNNMLDTTLWLSVCHTCHELIERNPLWAYEKGYSIKRLNK